MKTIANIKMLLKEYSTQCDEELNAPHQNRGNIRKKYQKKIDYAMTALRYLETNPDPNFVEKQLADTRLKICFYQERFGEWVKNNIVQIGGKNAMAIYHKEVGIDLLKQQIKMLQFILT